MTNDGKMPAVQHARERNALFRRRSGSVATLTGAAAGALATASLFAPNTFHSIVPSALATAAFVLFLFATGAFVAGSLHFRNSTGEDQPDPDRLRETGEAVLSRIKIYMSAGRWISGAAVVCLAAAAVVNLIPGSSVNVTVVLRDPAQAESVCAQLTNPFSASISSSDLTSETTMLRLRVAGDECKSGLSHAESVLLTVARDSATLVEQ